VSDISNLKEAMELNVRVFEDSLLPMLMLDGSGRIQRLNKAAVTMTGYPADRVRHIHIHTTRLEGIGASSSSGERETHLWSSVGCVWLQLQQEHFKMLLDYDWARQHEGTHTHLQPRAQIKEGI
jgi:PAS domain-containing protein